MLSQSEHDQPLDVCNSTSIRYIMMTYKIVNFNDPWAGVVLVLGHGHIVHMVPKVFLRNDKQGRVHENGKIQDPRAEVLLCYHIGHPN